MMNYTIGSNNYGQLGLTGVADTFKTPLKVTFFDQTTQIDKIACGQDHSMVLTQK